MCVIDSAVGPVTDTLVPGATRCCAGTKSPLTGLFFDTTFGGMFAAMQKRAGFEAVAITGRAPEPVYLVVHEDGAEASESQVQIEVAPEVNVQADPVALETVVRNLLGNALAAVTF